MDDAADFETWLRQLECPESFTPNHVVKKLQEGVLGILWEDLPKYVRPYPEVIETRKNILLYKLKNEPDDPVIKKVRETARLREERKKLAERIKIAEEKWRQKEFICRQKTQDLKIKKAETKKLTLKKEILKIKCEQMQTEIKNCVKMNGVCQHLMPPTIEEIPQSVITNCLSLVSNYSGGSEKRKVWNKISESLDPIKIPIIFNALLTARSDYTDYLINLDKDDHQNIDETRKNIDYSINKLHSEHFENEARAIIHYAKKANNDRQLYSYVESMEQIINELRPELADWLPLTLEVKKLDLYLKELEKEITYYKEEAEQDVSLDDTLNQLIVEIKIADDEIADAEQKVKNAFAYLKSSRTIIMKARESLLIQLEKLKLLKINEENQWKNIDLSTELINFNSYMDLDALRKIIIKGKTGAQNKHLKMCYNQAPFVFNNYRSDKLSNLPMLRVPIYYLIDFYKSFVANIHLSKRLNEESLTSFEDSSDSLTSPTPVIFPKRGICDLLRQVDLVRQRTQQHSEEFERIMKAWSEQSVREVVSLVFHDKTEYGYTLEEWEKRFSMIIYVLQKANISAN